MVISNNLSIYKLIYKQIVRNLNNIHFNTLLILLATDGLVSKVQKSPWLVAICTVQFVVVSIDMSSFFCQEMPKNASYQLAEQKHGIVTQPSLLDLSQFLLNGTCSVNIKVAWFLKNFCAVFVVIFEMSRKAKTFVKMVNNGFFWNILFVLVKH